MENKLGWSLSIVEREDEDSGFSVDPKRWIVERTFSWLGGWRRLTRDYERKTDSSETMVRAALLKIALNRLAQKTKTASKVSKFLGHSNVEQTQDYIDGFVDESRDEDFIEAMK